ncbi:Uncharacterised protein [Mycobacterium tuberculosis]|nr:Uncharacterised protein [Mycobacterium tuberculosis]
MFEKVSGEEGTAVHPWRGGALAFTPYPADIVWQGADLARPKLLQEVDAVAVVPS